MKLLPCQLFQLTSPRGGWHSADLPNTTHGIFQLTSSQGGWHWERWEKYGSYYFNSHPHKEDDVESYCIKFITIWYFNSHPHKEDDYRRSQSHIPVSISTHILTRRMTRQFQLRKWPAEVISTHILTRRMTSSRRKSTVSREISTHILTRRMTPSISHVTEPSTFQLTSSRGGWLRFCSLAVSHSYFNSHPHEEDDCCLWYTCFCTSTISTHILTRRMTPDRPGWTANRRYFNSHPHEEDDMQQCWKKWQTWSFQLTSSRGGWLLRIWK